VIVAVVVFVILGAIGGAAVVAFAPHFLGIVFVSAVAVAIAQAVTQVGAMVAFALTFFGVPKLPKMPSFAFWPRKKVHES
jgi:hypothetical protein